MEKFHKIVAHWKKGAISHGKDAACNMVDAWLRQQIRQDHKIDHPKCP